MAFTETVWFYGYGSLISGLILYIIAAVTLRYRDESGAYAFIGIMLGQGGWCLFTAANLFAQTLFWKTIFLKLTLISVFITPTMWVLFSLRFTHNTQLWTRKLKFISFGGAAFFIILMLTNEFHQLYMGHRPIVAEPFPRLKSQDFTLDKPLYIASYVYAYGLVVDANIKLSRLGLSSGKLHKRQIFILTIGMLVPIAANLFTIAGITPVEHVDLAPLVSVSGVYCLPTFSISTNYSTLCQLRENESSVGLMMQ